MKYISSEFDGIHPDILKRIKTPNHPLNKRTVLLFNKLVDATTDFDMLSIEFHNYPVHNSNKNDVQILYISQLGAIAHAICIFFDAAKNTVFIYDDKKTFIGSVINCLIYKRYPNCNITFVDPITRQRDLISCGLFTIAYATSLILGHDPKTRKLRTTPFIDLSLFSNNRDKASVLRKHILKMFRARKLLAFPNKIQTKHVASAVKKIYSRYKHSRNLGKIGVVE